LGLTSLKRKNLPIVVTLGGIGSCYASLAFTLIAFFLATNCAITWPKGKPIEDAIVIGTEEGGLYKLKGHLVAALTHSIEIPCELWHRRLAHINYKALPYVSKVVTGLPEFKVDHEGVCKGCAQGKNIKNPFQKRESKEEGVLELIHSDVCGPMTSTSLSWYVYCVIH
jgi:hypothetical protein